MSIDDVDAFAALGLDRAADADEVRAARRRLARELHPDAGGDTAAMAALNNAAARALQEIAARRSPGAPAAGAPDHTPPGQPPAGPSGRFRAQHDVPSFTVEALPAETFEALFVVANWFGEVVDDDPPYRLDLHLSEPVECWCRCEIVPDAGASTVSLTVGTDAIEPVPVETVRDLLVDALNRLDWEAISEEPRPS